MDQGQGLAVHQAEHDLDGIDFAFQGPLPGHPLGVLKEGDGVSDGPDLARLL